MTPTAFRVKFKLVIRANWEEEMRQMRVQIYVFVKFTKINMTKLPNKLLNLLNKYWSILATWQRISLEFSFHGEVKFPWNNPLLSREASARLDIPEWLDESLRFWYLDRRCTGGFSDDLGIRGSEDLVHGGTRREARERKSLPEQRLVDAMVAMTMVIDPPFRNPCILSLSLSLSPSLFLSTYFFSVFSHSFSEFFSPLSRRIMLSFHSSEM